MPPTRKRGQRAGLTTEGVLAAAQELLSEVGFEALSMRGIARRLDVAPNAVYAHVADKRDLVDRLLDDVLAAVEIHSAVLEPIPALRALMSDTYDVLLHHAELLPTFLVRQGARGENAKRLGEAVRTYLVAASVPVGKVRQAQHVLIIHTIGSAAFASHPNIDGDGAERPRYELRRDFTAGLDWMLFGMAGR